MKIDRSLFLILTGSLAGAACQVYVDDPPKTATNPPPPPTSNQSTPTPAAPPAPHVVHLKHPGNAVGPAPAPAPGPTPPPAPAGCLDTGQTTVGSCSQMQAPDPSCASSNFGQSRCNVYTQFFDPKVAAAAVKCEVGLSSKQVCDSSQSYNCGKAALLQACPDAQVAQFCAIATGPCKISASDCSAMVSGLNDQGQQQVATCVAQGCQAGLYSCVEGLGGAGPTPPTPPTPTPPGPSTEGVRHH